MKRIKDLQPGDRIDGGVFAVSVVEHKVVNDFSFITLTLADCSGKRLASLLNYSLEQYQLLLDSPIICVQGEVQTEKKYRGQIKISSCVSVPVPADVSPFVEPLRENNPALREHFCVLLGSIQEPSLGKLLHFIFDPGKGLLEDFCVAVAADKRHHAYRGGLLEHTLEVAELCDAVCRVMPCLDRDLLLACALLHDIGKLEEMEHGIRSGQYTASGSLIGHVVSGAHRVGRFAEKLPGGFPVRLKETLMHMILSHHGTVECGAARPPAFAEAQVLSQCDMISAQVVQYVDARADADGALSVWMPGREGRRAFVGDLGTQPLPAPDVVREASPMYVTKHQDAPYPNAEPLSFTTARRLPVLGLVAAGSPGQSSDEEQEAREVVPPFAGADYLLRVTGDSMKDAGMHEGDLLFVRHQKEANNGDIVVAHLAAQGQVVKKLRRGGGSEVWLDSQNSQADYPPIAFTAGDEIQGRVTGLQRDYR